MHNTHERHLDQIEERLLELKEILWDKPDRLDLEYQHDEVVSKLEQFHYALEELQGDLEDVKSQVDDLVVKQG